MPVKFPDPRLAGPEGLVAIGGDLEPETLLTAYRHGIFPWPIKGLPLTWFSPEERGVLFFDELHLSRSVKRMLKKHSFRLTVDQAFEQVIRGCASMARKPRGTWITPEIVQGYLKLHRLGHAHSIEVWQDDPQGGPATLVGGVYGVEVDGIFAAESMFRLVPNASKVGLLHLVDLLKAKGVEWIDVQVLTPHVAALGGMLLPRDEFLDLLEESLVPGKKLF